VGRGTKKIENHCFSWFKTTASIGMKIIPMEQISI